MRFGSLKNSGVALVICCALAAPTTATRAAQDKPSARSQSTISESELNSFVKAYVDYQRIRATYGPSLDSTKDPQRKKRIEQEANRKVKQSLDANGLTAERYNKIFAAVNSNDALRKRVLKKVQDQRQKS